MAKATKNQFEYMDQVKIVLAIPDGNSVVMKINNVAFEMIGKLDKKITEFEKEVREQKEDRVNLHLMFQKMIHELNSEYKRTLNKLKYLEAKYDC